MKKLIEEVTILLAASLSIFLMTKTASTVPLEHDPQSVPSYAGFADIQARKNRFIIVGDTQGTSHWEFWRETNDKERKLIIDEITKHEPAFAIHLGDLTTRGSSENHWREFDEMHKAFREKKIPYFPTLGNHELYGNDKKALHNYFERFPHLDKRRWYSFIWKNVGLILLDSNLPTLTKEQIEGQTQWYLDALKEFEKNTEIDFIVVCCHEPPFTNSRVVRPNEKVKVYFADPFLRFQKTCLFLSGHSHSYERFQMGDKLFIVSGGGGGPRHKVIIDPRKQRRQDLFYGPELRFFHFCEIENPDDTLIFRVLRLESDETFTVVDPSVIPRTKR